MTFISLDPLLSICTIKKINSCFLWSLADGHSGGREQMEKAGQNASHRAIKQMRMKSS